VRQRLVQYEIDRKADGSRLIRTRGLQRIGQDDLCVPVGLKRGHEWDHHVIGILDFMAAYVIRSNARIRADETATYGWTQLRFVRRDNRLLEVHEIGDVYSHDSSPGFVPGVDRAVRLTIAADEVMRRNGLAGVGDLPFRGKMAVACKHLGARQEPRLAIERMEPDDVDDSGWVVHCGIDVEAHESEDCFLTHLAHLGHDWPFVVPYLTLPLGCRVWFEEEGALVFKPGEKEGVYDPADAYAFGPWSFDPAS
jgi:hypothetical protein